MANTIKLKNASGSDPSASDLVVGEVALRTDNAALFTKKDDGSVAQIGASGVPDGDKGDITVSNSGATFTIDSGVIDNANVASNAAIAGSKISPTFTSDLTVEHTGNPTIKIHDTSGDNQCKLQYETDNFNWVAGLHGGINTYKISKSNAFGTNDYFQIDGNGTVDIANNLDVGAGLDVTGNITVTGTVDGRDLATDGSKLDGIASGATNVTNTNQLTNGAGFITATLTNEEVQDIVGGMVTGNTESGITVTYQDSDGTLDFTVGTLNQNTTGNAATATKLATARTIAGVSFDGSANISLNNNAITNGAGYITSADGGNAATLDGIDSSQFVRSDASDTLTGATYTFNSSTAEKIVLQGASSPFIRFKEGTTNKAYIQWNSNGFFDLINQETNEGLRIGSGSNGLQYRLDASYYTVWHSANDGSGSGLDSDTVDGIQASSFLRSDASDTCSGAITFSADCSFSGGGGAVSITANSDISLASGSWTGNHTKIQHHSNALYIVGGSAGIYFREGGTDRALIDGSGHFRPSTNNTYNLGTSSVRWANVFTNDLSLSNEGSKNDVDATWGSYTIQEGHHDLFLINKRTGKKYKFNLTEVN